MTLPFKTKVQKVIDLATGSPSPFPVFGPIDAHYDEAILASQKAKSTSSRHAIQYFEQYLNGIILQWNRMVTEIYQSFSPPVAGSKTIVHLRRQEELDFHFYLICWDKVRKYFALVEKLEHDNAISKSYGKVSELLLEAKKGRDFYEHLDEELRNGGIGTRGRGFSYPEGYHFSYIRVKGGQPVERKVNLGMEEIRRIGEAFEDVIAILKARGEAH